MDFFFVFFLFGLLIGSFLNVLVYRLKDAETLLGRSFCRKCKHQIRWYDNIPLISFVLLRGECRDCQEKISWQYPVLECVTGLLFGLVGFFFFNPLVTASYTETVWLLITISSILVVAVYDMRHMEIPMVMLFVSAFFTFLFLLETFFSFPEPFFSSRLFFGLSGGLVVAGFFFLLVWMSHETWMGFGDVWLGLLCGLIVGLPLVLPMLTLSFGIGAIVGLTLIAWGKKGMKSQMPFAPFLVFGTLLILFLPKIFPVLSQFLFV